ncbi:MAG: phosphoadenosine phosphosulfate reductase family protein [Betaproteobacteria bacterium]|nr:phosphoadenosine phosphosulfate reductase family protein [Betaproteobacteria bacterium]
MVEDVKKGPCRSVAAYRIDSPTIISFSGGRTSGLMLYRILEAHDGKLPDDIHVVFANTGKEMPETLDFVQECSQRWNVSITWVEYADHNDPQLRWKIVDYASASRHGEPFAAMIGRRKMLPNPVMRMCTGHLKVRPKKLYVQQVLGWTEWDVAIGFRADELHRVARLSKPHKEPYERFAPLARAGITAVDVSAFWQAQPFDLQLPNHNGKTMHGNCDLCFLKGAGQIMSLIRECPSRAKWWMEQESRITTTGGQGHLFRKDRPSYADMFRIVEEQDEFPGFDDFAVMDCACTD